MSEILASLSLVCTSIKVPPTKSMPKLSPTCHTSNNGTTVSRAEMTQLMVRNLTKPIRVSGGTK